MMDARERRLRATARRHGLMVVKSRRRNRSAPDYGRMFILPATDHNRELLATMGWQFFVANGVKLLTIDVAERQLSIT